MLRLIARRLVSQSVVPGADAVVLGMTLPSDTVVTRIKMDCHLLSSVYKNTADVVMYAMEGWVLPIQDVDLADTYDDIWDALVPKDTDVEVMDLDTQALDTTPFYEPGEVDWTALFDVGLKPKRIYQRIRILSAARGSLTTAQDVETPFSAQWVPGEHFTVNINRPIRVKQPSVLVFAVASPAQDDNNATVMAALGENQIPRVKYMGHVLEQALLHTLGIIEAGAETPWEEATALLKAHLDPDPFDSAGTSLATQTYRMVAQSMIHHKVKGELGKTVVTTGR